MLDFIQKYFKGDQIIWIILLSLIVISAVEMYSASSTLAFKQGDYNSPIWRHILFLATGFCIVFVVHLIPHSLFPIGGGVLLLLTPVLLGITLIVGKTDNDATRWLEIGGFQFQPSELAKLAVIIILAVLLGRKQKENKSADEAFKTCIIILSCTCALILTENFSTAFLLFLVGFLMMFFGRISLKKLGITLGVLVSFSVLLYFIAPLMPEPDEREGRAMTAKDMAVISLHRLTTWQERIDNYLYKEEEQNEAKNFGDLSQESHAKIAIANSNGIGKGPGNSIQRNFLPQAYSDFIFAIIIEETGLIGAFAVMFLYLILLFRAAVIANKCPSAFPALLVLGLTTMIVVQAFLNMAVAVGLAPVTGQPLPMISRGGTSIIVTSIYFGIILSISRYVKDVEQSSQSPAKESSETDLEEVK